MQAVAERQTVEQFCITCEQSGHTYINCPRAPFVEIMLGAFDLPDLTGKREETMRELAKLRSDTRYV